MDTQVEFRSAKFPPYEGEEEEVNPGLWGRRLAEYLEERLSAAGLPTLEVFCEDWGWVVPIENVGFPLWVGCGHQNGDDDQFLCFVHPDRPTVRRMFRKHDTTSEVGRVTEVLRAILSADPDIQGVSWRDDI